MSWLDDYDYPMSETFLKDAIRLHTGKDPDDMYAIERRLENIENTLERLCKAIEKLAYFESKKTKRSYRYKQDFQERGPQNPQIPPKSKGVVI